jgi:CheY-like chemotaxis protein
MKQHILLVDDDKDEMEILTDALRKVAINCKCTWAKDSLHALEILAYLKPDIIFVDYNMPKMNGIVCIRAIRQLTGYSEVPLVLYSNLNDEAIFKEALAAGVTTCLRKTASFNELCQNLHDLFKKSNASFN